MQTLRALHEAGSLDPLAEAQLFSPSRPAEELYAWTTDRWRLTSLAGDPSHQATLADLRKRLDHWMVETRDPGPEPGEAYDRAMEAYLREVPAQAPVNRRNIEQMKRWAAEGR